jgi:hypothetical protein
MPGECLLVRLAVTEVRLEPSAQAGRQFAHVPDRTQALEREQRRPAAAACAVAG